MNQEEVDSPHPGNAGMNLDKNILLSYLILAFYLCEVENVGSEGNELTGFVYTDTKKVDAKFFVCFCYIILIRVSILFYFS